MNQSRSLSAFEAAANVILGWLIALATQALIFPVLGMQVMLWQHLALSGVFTALSFLRSYVLRRVFVRWSTHAEAIGPDAEVSPTPGRRLQPN